jgi:uncharacterized protein YjbJ (UPF0337 family)
MGPVGEGPSMEDTSTERFHRIKGRLKRRMGWLTADRRVEAEGEAEAQVHDDPGEAAVADKEQEVKRRYGETLDSRP